MIKFILYNPPLDYFILFFSIFNIIVTNGINNDNCNNENYTNFQKFAKFVSLFYSFLFFILMIIYLLFNRNYIYFLITISILTIIKKTYYNIINKSFDLSYENKKLYFHITIILLFFLQSSNTLIYMNLVEKTSHLVKEILLLSYISFKTISYLFIIILLTTIALSNARKISKGFFSKILLKIRHKSAIINQYFVYRFKLYNKYKNNLSLVIDMIIFFISYPIFLLINIISKVTSFIIYFITTTLLRIILIISKYDDDTKRKFKTIMSITIIISLLFINIIVLHYKNIFSEEIANIYNLIATVVLIPLIYDNIKRI